MATQNITLNPGDVLTVQVPATVVTPPPPVLTAPGLVTDLRVLSATASSITLAFTEVSGGNGLPASYDLRYSPTPLVWSQALGAVQVAGTTVGNQRTVVISGLLPFTEYQFEIVAYRGTLNVDAIFGPLSNIVSGATLGAVVLPPPSLTNEPANFHVLTDQPWAFLRSLGWDYLQRAASKPSFITTDVTAPKSPPNILRIVFTPGMSSDSEPGVHFIPLGSKREVYWRYYLRISSGWHASPAGACKMTYCMAPSSNLWTALNHPPGQIGPPFQAVARAEWLGRYYIPNKPWTPINPGEWVFYEWYVKLASSQSATDGILRCWVNGKLNSEYLDVPGTPASSFGEFQIAPTVQQAPTVEQYMDVDHIYVSTP